MFSSIVKAGMRAITPRGGKAEEGAESNATHKDNGSNKNNHFGPHPTTPKAQMSQASVATPSTASTVDITANNTTLDESSFALDAGKDSSKQENDTIESIQTNETSRKDGEANSNESNSTTASIANATTPSLSTNDLWGVLDTQLRTNIGASVRCGICLSTVVDPVRTQCSHVFCRSCITNYLRATGPHSTCPECKAPCTRRSLETFSEMDEMADAYKHLLRSFGLAPGIYTPEITTMTQKVVSSFSGEDDDEGLDPQQAMQARLDRLCVSATYQCSNKMQKEENEQVVAANFKACFDNNDENEAMEKLLDSRLQEAISGHANSNSNSNGSNSKSETLSQAYYSLPNTQDVQEQAREQLEADREMQESMEREEKERLEAAAKKDDEDDDDFFTLRKKKATSDPFALPHEEEQPPSPPIWARADSDSKNIRNKSFSKRDQRPSFGGNALSPIDHEASYWTVDDNGENPESNLRDSTSSLGITHVTGMLEDSRGGLHMMPMSGAKSLREDGEYNDDDDDDNSEDKTIAMTLDDSPAFSRSSNDNESNNSRDENNNSHQESLSPASNSSSSNSSRNKFRDPFPLTYDPIGNPTEITEEYHESTKTEISNAANLPAGKDDEEEDLNTQKALFSTESASNANRDKKKPATRKSARRSALRKQAPEEEQSSNASDSETPSEEFAVGTIVRVQSRTWPGVNKQGGVGRITGTNADGTYNVAYVLGGKESGIDAVFVSKEGETKDSRKRRRAQDSLPEELLKQLAEEGFDVPGVKKAKKKKAARVSFALADTTNQIAAPSNGARLKRGRRATSSNTSEAPSAEIPQSTTNQPRGRRKKDSSNPPPSKSTAAGRRRKQSRKEESQLPKTVKKTKEPLAPSETKTNTAKKTVTWSSTEPSAKRASRKKPPPQVADQKLIESNHEEAFGIADAFYKERLEKAIRNGSVVAVCSNLSEADNAIFHSLRSGQVLTSTETVDENTHLCIVPSMGTGNNNLVAGIRSLKVMLSALKGIPLVSPDWLRTCYLQKSIVLPHRFLRTIPTKEAAIKASGEDLCGVTRLAVARSKNNSENLPFDSMFVCLCGSYKGETKTNLQKLLETGGAKILSTSTDVEAKLQEVAVDNAQSVIRIAIVCGNSGRGGTSLGTPVKRQLRDLLREHQKEDCESKSRVRAIVVDSKWVIESVTCAKAMAPNLFEPSILNDVWKLCL